MRVVLAAVSSRAGKSKLPGVDAMVEEYLGRLSDGAGRWLQAESRVFASEAALLTAAGSKSQGKAPAVLALLDSRGRQMSSEEFAAWLGQRRDAGVPQVWLAVGPADGWSAAALAAADLKLSLGAMTLAHELARAVAAEQIYRAWAILERHPYHKGH
jgi:23S rRNA (pseudouridine1915-N3)-methyltransferase